MRLTLISLLASLLATGCFGPPKATEDNSLGSGEEETDAADTDGDGGDDDVFSLDDDDGDGDGDGDGGDGGDGGGDGDGGGTDGGSTDGGGTDGGGIEPGVLPEPPSQAGVVYVGDYVDSMLRWYDITGDVPQVGGQMDMGNSVHDLAVDSVNDIMAAAIDIDRKVVLFALDDPAGGVDAPTVLSEVTFDEPPFLVQLDPYHDRLYVHTVVTGAGTVHIVDISDVRDPEILSSNSSSIFASWSLDAVRRVLFLSNGAAQTLEAYDVGKDILDPLPGSPIDLRADYPEDNSWGFQAYAMIADPWSSRVFAGRLQGNLSELIAYEYSDFIPDVGETYSDGATAETMASLPDAIDLEVDLADRHVPLLTAYTALPDTRTGEVLLVGAAYDVTSMNAGILSLNADLGPSGTCESEDGPFCWYRYWTESGPEWSLPTDGAACIDSKRRIAAGSAITDSGEGAGTMQFFEYDSDGNLAPWLSEEGRLLNNGPLAVSMACH